MEAVAGKGEAEAVVTVVMVAWVAAAECTMERVGASVWRQNIGTPLPWRRRLSERQRTSTASRLSERRPTRSGRYSVLARCRRDGSRFHSIRRYLQIHQNQAGYLRPPCDRHQRGRWPCQIVSQFCPEIRRRCQRPAATSWYHRKHRQRRRQHDALRPFSSPTDHVDSHLWNTKNTAGSNYSWRWSSGRFLVRQRPGCCHRRRATP